MSVFYSIYYTYQVINKVSIKFNNIIVLRLNYIITEVQIRAYTNWYASSLGMTSAYSIKYSNISFDDFLGDFEGT